MPRQPEKAIQGPRNSFSKGQANSQMLDTREDNARRVDQNDLLARKDVFESALSPCDNHGSEV